MSSRRFAIHALSALSLVAFSYAVKADPTNAATHLDFTVLKDGSPIGHHHIDLEQNGDKQIVSIKTDILVKVAFIPVYRFEHAGNEVWQNGKLISLHSKTNDDGDRHTLAVSSNDNHLDVVGDNISTPVEAGIIPASLWNRDLVHQKVLLNTLTGKQMQVGVSDLGEDTVQSKNNPVKASHYKVTGDLQRELWYDATGTLIQVRFKAKDDSDILYTLG